MPNPNLNTESFEKILTKYGLACIDLSNNDKSDKNRKAVMEAKQAVLAAHQATMDQRVSEARSSDYQLLQKLNYAELDDYWEQGPAYLDGEKEQPDTRTPEEKHPIGPDCNEDCKAGYHMGV